jgi:hypothetical protein
MKNNTTKRALNDKNGLEHLLDIDQASAVLRISHWSLRRAIKLDHLRCLRIGRRILIEPSELRRVVAVARKAAKVTKAR